MSSSSSRSGSWSSAPSSRMSTSIPHRSVKPSPLSAATSSRCARSRSGDSPFATRSRGEWSVSARYSWPRARPAAAMSEIDVSPSDQSLWLCRSPRRAFRSVEATSTPARSRRSARYDGTVPSQRLLDDGEGRVADALAPAEGCGIPQLLVGQTRDRVGRRPERLRLVPRGALALEERRDLDERVVRVDDERRGIRGASPGTRAVTRCQDVRLRSTASRPPARWPGGGAPSRRGSRRLLRRRRRARRRRRRPR